MKCWVRLDEFRGCPLIQTFVLETEWSHRTHDQSWASLEDYILCSDKASVDNLDVKISKSVLPNKVEIEVVTLCNRKQCLEN
jgi:hypothetical protein